MRTVVAFAIILGLIALYIFVVSKYNPADPLKKVDVEP